jgi:hypothetical protein
MQAFGNNAVYIAASSQSGIRDNTHQTFYRSAIDQGYARFSQSPTKCSCTVSEFFGGPVV